GDVLVRVRRRRRRLLEQLAVTGENRRAVARGQELWGVPASEAVEPDGAAKPFVAPDLIRILAEPALATVCGSGGRRRNDVMTAEVGFGWSTDDRRSSGIHHRARVRTGRDVDGEGRS